MTKAIYFFLIIAIVSGITGVLYSQVVQKTATPPDTTDEKVMCTMDAMQCLDGTYVGRTGPNCEFVCPDTSPQISTEYMIESLSDLIVVETVRIGDSITSGMKVAGKARGGWYFEASFPVMVVNWEGLIIGQGIATAQGDWMTTEFVPFTTTLTFESPYKPGDPDFMKRGTLILQKDNPSGLPENDAALEIPVTFAP
jgi:Immunoglobulin-like domain of bacterial spore germination